MGCTSWPSTPAASAIDAGFRLRKIESTAPTGLQSPGVRAYQRGFGKILGSQCRYYPSDSRYHVTVSKSCGPFKATLKSMSRFLLEYDAPKLGRPMILLDGKIHYEDLPENCDWI